ncbi:ClbS/DfsB family four-helix bundle protein [Agromyces soli]
MATPEHPLPTTLIGLQAAAMRGFRALEEVYDATPDAQRSAPFARAVGGGEGAEASGGTSTATPRDRDLQDVVNHLHAWHVLLLGWLDAIAAGRAPAYPAEGRGWAQLDELNRELRDTYRVREFDTAWRRLQTSHVGVLARVGALDEAELFDAARFAWLGGSPLAEPVHECLGGHYAWAVETIESRR